MPRLSALALALAALLALAVPSLGAKSGSGPKISNFSPTQPELGGKLTLFGKGFAKQRKRNTVVLRAPNGGSTFIKPTKAERRKLMLKVPGTLERLMKKKDGLALPTRFRVRVLAGKRFGPWTAKKASLVVHPSGSGSGPGQPADCDQDGVANEVDADDDNDLLTDKLETDIKLDVCVADTDQDGLEDGFEYQSALDLNDDEDQEPNTSLPYPGKRPYPNPLDPSDVDKDFDRDVLTLSEEHKLWKYAIASGSAERTLSPLYYSDGEQYSMNTRGADGRRRPTLQTIGYAKQVSFLNWASDNGYRTVMLENGSPWWDHENVRTNYWLLDFNRNGEEDGPEPTYYDFNANGYLSDNERDEDADGLTNYDEQHGRATPEYWAACYDEEGPFPVSYEAPSFVDPDSDGDGVRDGADDIDHDDIPTVMELSRIMASGVDDRKPGYICEPAEGLPQPPDQHHPTLFGRMNPFNPCLPAVWSRTCDKHPSFEDAPAPFDDSPNWYSLN